MRSIIAFLITLASRSLISGSTGDELRTASTIIQRRLLIRKKPSGFTGVASSSSSSSQYEEESGNEEVIANEINNNVMMYNHNDRRRDQQQPQPQQQRQQEQQHHQHGGDGNMENEKNRYQHNDMLHMLDEFDLERFLKHSLDMSIITLPPEPTRPPTNKPNTIIPTQAPQIVRTPSPTTDIPTPPPQIVRTPSPTTDVPTSSPTTIQPSTITPSPSPSLIPSTSNPTLTSIPVADDPSASPTTLPTVAPTSTPTIGLTTIVPLTDVPSQMPSVAPTAIVITTDFPSTSPSQPPTNATATPTGMPSTEPTATIIIPTVSPTNATATPTGMPSVSPTNATATPSGMPSTEPTVTIIIPTVSPSQTPTSAPSVGTITSAAPTTSPTAIVTTSPSASPSLVIAPSEEPTSTTAPLGNIFEIVNSNDNLSTLSQTFALADANKNNTPPFFSGILTQVSPTLTLFGPNDDAFAIALESFSWFPKYLTRDYSLHLFDLLAYHIGTPTFFTSSFPLNNIPNLQRSTLDVELQSGTTNTFFVNSSNPTPSGIVDPNITATNGVVHIVNEVAWPTFITYNPWEAIQNLGSDFTIFRSFIETANFQTTLISITDSTVLVMPNEAIPLDTEEFLLDPVNRGNLTAFLKYLVLTFPFNYASVRAPFVYFFNETLQQEGVIVGVVGETPNTPLPQLLQVTFNQAVVTSTFLSQDCIGYILNNVIVPSSLSTIIPRSIPRNGFFRSVNKKYYYQYHHNKNGSSHGYNPDNSNTHGYHQDKNKTHRYRQHKNDSHGYPANSPVYHKDKNDTW